MTSSGDHSTEVTTQNEGTGSLLLGGAALLLADLPAIAQHLASLGSLGPWLTLGVLLLLSGRALGARRSRGSAAAIVDNGELRLQGERLWARYGLRWLTSGSYDPISREVVIEHRLGDELRLRMEPATGRRLLTALGFRARGGATTLVLGAPPSRWWVHRLLLAPAAVAAFLLSLQHHHVLGFALALVAVLTSWFLLHRWLRPLRLAVGADGLEIQRRFERRFVSFRQLRSLVIDGGNIELTLQDCESLFLPVGGALSAAAAHELQDELRRRLSAFRQRHEGGGPALGRAGRSIGDWRRALAELRAARSYRASVLDDTDLEAIVASPAESAEQRIGAALALDSSAGRKRVARVARESLDPRLRVALDRIAHDLDAEDAIEAALRAEGRADERRAGA